MKREEKDILQDTRLKEPPFSMPEGYLSSLETKLKSIPQQGAEKVTVWKKVTPHIAMAAMFALIMAAGGFFLGRSWTQKGITEQYAEAVTEDDIVEYLIYTGVEVDELELY